MRTPDGLKAVAAYADGIGPNKDVVTADLVKAAHAAGLGAVLALGGFFGESLFHQVFGELHGGVVRDLFRNCLRNLANHACVYRAGQASGRQGPVSQFDRDVQVVLVAGIIDWQMSKDGGTGQPDGQQRKEASR